MLPAQLSSPIHIVRITVDPMNVSQLHLDMEFYDNMYWFLKDTYFFFIPWKYIDNCKSRNTVLNMYQWLYSSSFHFEKIFLLEWLPRIFLKYWKNFKFLPTCGLKKFSTNQDKRKPQNTSNSTLLSTICCGWLRYLYNWLMMIEWCPKNMSKNTSAAWK